MSANRRKVWLSHDGGIDDLQATLLLAVASDPLEKIELVGVTVIGADCLTGPAVTVTEWLLDIMGHPDVPVGRSSAEAIHPFPVEWRVSCVNCLDFPVLHTDYANHRKLLGKHSIVESLSGEEHMARTILQTKGSKVTIVATGPLSDVAYGIDKYGESFTSKVDELIVMGGALDVPGNAPIPHDSTSVAEWNFYWDPISAKTVYESDINIVQFLLDVTNAVPITHDFVRKFGPLSTRYPAANFAGCAWSLTTHRPYYAWDVLTCSYLLDPTLCQVREERIAVDIEGKYAGRTRRVEDGKLVKVAREVDANRFYDLVLRYFQSVSYE